MTQGVAKARTVGAYDQTVLDTPTSPRKKSSRPLSNRTAVPEKNKVQCGHQLGSKFYLKLDRVNTKTPAGDQDGSRTVNSVQDGSRTVNSVQEGRG